MMMVLKISNKSTELFPLENYSVKLQRFSTSIIRSQLDDIFISGRSSTFNTLSLGACNCGEGLWAYASLTKSNAKLTLHQQRDQMDRSTCHHYDLEAKPWWLDVAQANDGISSTILSDKDSELGYKKMQVIRSTYSIRMACVMREKVWLVFCLDTNLWSWVTYIRQWPERRREEGH